MISLYETFFISIVVEYFSSIYYTGISNFNPENSSGHFDISHVYGILISFVDIVPDTILHFNIPSSYLSFIPITFYVL